MQLFSRLSIIIQAMFLFTEMDNTNILVQNENVKNNGRFFWGFCLFGVFLCFIPVILLFLLLVIAVWMYKDAEKRGKSGELWLIIGLLLPFIGLIIWLIVRPPEPSFYEKKAGKPETERACPSCGRNIPVDARVCPYCGKKFEES